MHVLLLSGTGWVGSTIVNELLDHGYDITVMSRGTTRQGFDASRTEMVTCDREDLEDMGRKLRRYAKDVIIDVISGHYSAENTEFVADCVEGRVGHYLQCSSTGVFAPLAAIPGNETDPITTCAQFGDGWFRKAEADRVILRRMEKGFPGTILHPSIIMGPGAYAIDNLGDRRTTFLREIKDGSPIYLANGGTNLMQMVHVKDLGRAFRLAIEHETSKGQDIIISGVRAITARRYVEATAKLLGCTANIRNIPAEELLARKDIEISPNDFAFFMEHMSFDLSKAKKLIGYEPSYSLESMMNEVIEWTRSQGML